MKNKSFVISSKTAKLLSLFLTLILLITGTLAWFYSKLDNDVKSTEVTVVGDETFELSLDGVNYSSSIINVSRDETFISANKDLALNDITGNGISFLDPPIDQSKNPPEVKLDADWSSDVVAGRDYISFDLYFRAKVPMNIYLASGSTLMTSCELREKNLTDTNASNIYNKSDGGMYSRDCIVGAMRTAFCSYSQYDAAPNSTAPSDVELLWIPRSDILYNSTSNTVRTGISDSSLDTQTHYYYDFDKVKKQYIHLTVSGDQATGEIARLDTSSSSTYSSPYYISKVRINIWLEGTDPEARKVFSGGNFKIQFNFTSYT